MSTYSRIAGFVLLALGAAAPVNAASVSYYLDQSNVLDDGTNWLQVTIADGIDGAIDFTVEILEPLQNLLAAGNAGIAKFAFNVIPGVQVPLANIDISGLAPGWAKGPQLPMDSFGTFTRRLRNTDAHTPLFSVLQFSVIGLDYDTVLDYVDFSKNSTEGPTFFSAFVQGITPPGCIGKHCTTGAFFGGMQAVVPVPAAVWLMLSGIGLLTTLRRQ